MYFVEERGVFFGRRSFCFLQEFLQDAGCPHLLSYGVDITAGPLRRGLTHESSPFISPFFSFFNRSFFFPETDRPNQ